MSDQHLSHWPSWKLPVFPSEVSVTRPLPCTYLPGRSSSFRVLNLDDHSALSPEGYQRLLDAGFRRSGNTIYQPMCPNCRDCVPLRVPLDSFQPSKSQRRVLRRNADLLIQVATPLPTPEKWELYLRYQRQWHHNPAAPDDPSDFLDFLYRSPVDSLEFEYRDRGSNLLGVGICDLTPQSLSSVYFFFDPRHARRSLGTFSALYEIQWARQNRLHFWYAGYWIQNCPAMSYKSRFQPAQILSTDTTWRPLPPNQ
jgi:leucyl-tRNA---protein transferase